mgnify:CR=1 FL=1
MRQTIIACALFVLMAGSDAHSGGILRIFGGAGSGEFYRGGGGAAFGLDIPVSEERAFYLGLHFTAHNGSKDQVLPDGISGGSAVIGDASQSQIGAEIGVSLASYPWVVRPTVGGGISRIALDSGTIVLNSEIRSLFSAGATVGYMITETAMVGFDVRVMRVGDLGNSVAGYVTLGTTFGN